jgi:hypothetical protein
MATDENDLVRLKGFKCLKKKEKKNIYSYFRMASFKKSNFSCRKGFIYGYDFFFEKFKHALASLYTL